MKARYNLCHPYCNHQPHVADDYSTDGTGYSALSSLHEVLLGSSMEAQSTNLLNKEHVNNQSKANKKQKGPNTGGQGQPAEIRIPAETFGGQTK